MRCSLFKLVRELTSVTTPSLPTHTDKELLANAFSDHFTTKVRTIRQHLDLVATEFEEPETSCTSAFEDFSAVTEDDVNKIIMKFPAKSCDLDPMPSWLVKDCLCILLQPITQIVNTSLRTGVVPRCFKQAVITPLLKKPSLDKEILKNYRPVSNLSYISKVLERIVAHKVQTYIQENNLHDVMQSAYRPYHSTETALLKIHNDVMIALDEGNEIILLLLDLSSAFDTVDHTVLLKRLECSFGISGKVLSWFSSYLDHRQQSVTIGDSQSQPQPLVTGVPQGSVLGPILFTIYMSPLGELIRSHGCQYICYSDLSNHQQI